MQRRPIVAGIGALAALGMAILVGCGGGKKSPDAEVVARVNGTEITRGDVVRLLEQKWSGEALGDLISQELIRAKAKERNLKATDEEINRRLAIIADTKLIQTGKPFEQWVKDNGQTVEQYREQSRMQVLIAKMVIPPAVEKSFFEANKEQLKGAPYNNEAVIYRQLVVGSKADAEAIAKQVAAAKDKDAEFAKLAKEKSLDPMTRPAGGMSEPMLKGSGDPDLEKTLFALKPGAVSQPIPFPNAAGQQWQVVTVVKHYPPHAIRLEDNEDVIEGALLGGQTNDPQILKVGLEAKQFFSSLTTKGKIEILSPRYKALDDWFKQQREAAAQAPPPGGAEGFQPGPAPETPAPAQKTK